MEEQQIKLNIRGALVVVTNKTPRRSPFHPLLQEEIRILGLRDQSKAEMICQGHFTYLTYIGFYIISPTTFKPAPYTRATLPLSAWRD